jgi:hypothetical protein
MPANRHSPSKRQVSKRTLGLMAALVATAILTAAALLAGSYERMIANPSSPEELRRG